MGLTWFWWIAIAETIAGEWIGWRDNFPKLIYGPIVFWVLFWLWIGH